MLSFILTLLISLALTALVFRLATGTYHIHKAFWGQSPKEQFIEQHGLSRACLGIVGGVVAVPLFWLWPTHDLGKIFPGFVVNPVVLIITAVLGVIVEISEE